MHPLKYTWTLLSRIPGRGSYVFQEAEAEEVQADPLTVHSRSIRTSRRFPGASHARPAAGQDRFHQLDDAAIRTTHVHLRTPLPRRSPSPWPSTPSSGTLAIRTAIFALKAKAISTSPSSVAPTTRRDRNKIQSAVCRDRAEAREDSSRKRKSAIAGLGKSWKRMTVCPSSARSPNGTSSPPGSRAMA